MEMALEQDLLTVDEIAMVLKVPKSWVYQRTRRGQDAIPHIKVGGYLRFEKDKVLEFFKNAPERF